jgi:hypothetical protein
VKNIFKAGILIFVGLMSCQDGEQLTPEQRYIVDTLYARQLNTLRLKGDSICRTQKDSMYQMAVDSLQDVYLEEFEYYFRKTYE